MFGDLCVLFNGKVVGKVYQSPGSKKGFREGLNQKKRLIPWRRSTRKTHRSNSGYPKNPDPSRIFKGLIGLDHREIPDSEDMFKRIREGQNDGNVNTDEHPLLMEEILHQLVGNFSKYLHVFTRFYTSQVVQDFFHQQ